MMRAVAGWHGGHASIGYLETSCSRWLASWHTRVTETVLVLYCMPCHAVVSSMGDLPIAAARAGKIDRRDSV